MEFVFRNLSAETYLPVRFLATAHLSQYISHDCQKKDGFQNGNKVFHVKQEINFCIYENTFLLQRVNVWRVTRKRSDSRFNSSKIKFMILGKKE